MRLSPASAAAAKAAVVFLPDKNSAPPSEKRLKKDGGKVRLWGWAVNYTLRILE